MKKDRPPAVRPAIKAIGMILTGCLGILCILVFYKLYKGKEAAEDQRESAEISQGIYMPNDTFRAEDPSQVNLAGLLQEKAAGTAVSIETDALRGSGVIWSMDEAWTTVITAGHVMNGWKSVQVTFAGGGSVSTGSAGVGDGEGADENADGNAGGPDEEGAPQIEVTLYADADLAVIRIPTEKIPEETRKECRYVAVDRERYDALAAQDAVLVLGSGETAGDSAYEGVLLEPWIYTEDFGQYMMIARVYAYAGMSGGGVFDEEGYFAGLICGGNEKDELAVLPLGIILAKLSDGGK